MDAAIVPDFVVVDTDYRNLPDRMVGDVRSFARSQEYTAIGDVERHRPEVVFSALIKLCIRLHKKEQSGRLLWGERATLRQIHKLFEKIARSHAASTKYTLVTIMFDRLAQDEGWEVLPLLRKRFGPATSELFNLWIM